MSSALEAGLVSKVLGGLSKKKDTKPLYSYEVIGHGGAKDGILLQQGEQFSRSWTILNTAPALTKEKEKEKDSNRVVRIVQHSGEPLKEYVLFLWPDPGCKVTLTLNLVAPYKAGWCESYWMLEGEDEEEDAKPNFWVKFEVLDFAIEPPPEEPILKSPKSRKKRRRKKHLTKSLQGSGIGKITLIDSRANSDSTAMVEVHSESPRKKTKRSQTVLELTPKGKKRKKRSPRSKLVENEMESKDENGNSVSFDVKESDKNNIVDYPDPDEFIKPPLERTTSKQKKFQSKSAMLHLSTEDIMDSLEPNVLDNNKKIVRYKFKQDKLFSGVKSRTGSIRIIDEQRTKFLEQWQEKIVNGHVERNSVVEKKKVADQQERALSLKNIHSIKKKTLLDTTTPRTILPTLHRLRSSSTPLSTSIPLRQQKELTQPNISTVLEAENQMKEFIDLAYKLQGSLQLTVDEFTVDRRLSDMSNLCISQIKSFLSCFEESHKRFKGKANDIKNVYLIENIPADIWLKIFSYLDVKSLGRVAQCCSFWKYISGDDSLWEEKYSSLNLPIGPPECLFVTEGFRYKALYKIEASNNWFENNDNSDSRTISNSEKIFGNNDFPWPIYDLHLFKDTLVSVSECVRVIDFKKKRLCAALDGHEKAVVSVSMLGQSKCVTGSLDKTLKIWNLSQYKCAATLEGHQGSVNSIMPLKDVIISSSMQDKTVRFWNPRTTENVHTIESKDGIACLAINQATKSPHIYFGTVSGKVVQWDIETQQSIFSQKVTMGMVEGLQVFGDVIAASDYTRMTLKSINEPILECVSPMMDKNIGRLKYDGYKLGAQVGNRIDVFDVRYLYDKCGKFTVDNLWKGAFQFVGDSLVVGAGSGCLYNYTP